MKYFTIIMIALAIPLLVLAKGEGSSLPPQLAIGSPAPEFALVNTVDGKTIKIADYKGKSKAVCVVWFCNHCPVAKAYEERIVALAKQFQPQGARFILISSNDTTFVPQDGPAQMRERAIADSFPFPYLFDPTQDVARAYGARVTPHVFLFDGNLILRYRGAVDDDMTASDAKEHYLNDALSALIEGKPDAIKTPETTAEGCSIKWQHL